VTQAVSEGVNKKLKADSVPKMASPVKGRASLTELMRRANENPVEAKRIMEMFS
jgi:hypothetical protein